MMHSFGLNIRQLGFLVKKTSQPWLKLILKTELAVRCLKNFYRYDLQHCILNQRERIDLHLKQTDRERHQVIMFLNVVLGDTEHTFHLWRSLNHYCKMHFKIALW